jgi:hypothetical protein
MLHYLRLESLTFAEFRILINERGCEVQLCFACSHQPPHFVANVLKHVDGRCMLRYTTTFALRTRNYIARQSL